MHHYFSRPVKSDMKHGFLTLFSLVEHQCIDSHCTVLKSRKKIGQNAKFLKTKAISKVVMQL